MIPAARIVVLISGEGTNLQAIIDACESNIINARISHVFSNRNGVRGLIRAAYAGIASSVVVFDKTKESRDSYDQRLSVLVEKQNPTLIVLAGWMHILGDGFLSRFSEDQIINLHPALPGRFPGAHAVEDAIASGVNETGVMVHTVVAQIDAGSTIAKMKVPIIAADTVDSLRARISFVEKTVLVIGIIKQLNNLRRSATLAVTVNRVAQKQGDKIASGKVRDIYFAGYGMLMMVASDRLSCFDRSICKIPHKGKILNDISAWWFKRTQHIVKNHLVYTSSEHPLSIVKHCDVFAIEFVVRGYITGSTNTAMWTLYEKGVRQFGDDIVSEGLWKNQRLDHPIVTPTTKSDEHDQPINRKEIIAERLMSAEHYDECCKIALQLFEFGQMIAEQKGLILVDTKYEFGLERNTGNIILVDEIHTCDSSRYWEAESYDERFEIGLEPIKFDKDIIRNWLRERCDPYAIDEQTGEPLQLPEIPDDLVTELSAKYIEFYERLTGEQFVQGFSANYVARSSELTKYYNQVHSPIVILVAKEDDNVEMLTTDLQARNIYTKVLRNNPRTSTSDFLDAIDLQQSEYKHRRVLYVALDDLAFDIILSHQSRFPVIGETTADNIARFLFVI